MTERPLVGKPRVERDPINPMLWWVAATVLYRGHEVYASRPCDTWDEALTFANKIAVRGHA